MSGEGTITAASSELPSDRSVPTASPCSISTNSPESDEHKANSSVATLGDGSEEVGTLEWAQVIELQAFSDRKVWIEEKTRVNTIPIFRDLFPGGTEDIFPATRTNASNRGLRWIGHPPLCVRSHQFGVTHKSRAQGLGRRTRQDRKGDGDFRCWRV